MTAFKLLALDLDGTLLTDEKTITEQTRLWVRRAADKGVVVIFSTGRGVQTAECYWQELSLQSPMVLLNGADIWECPGRLWKRTLLPHGSVRRMQELALRHGAKFWAYGEGCLTSHLEWNESMLERDWMKFGMRHDDPAVLVRIRATLLEWGMLEVTSSDPLNLEMSAKGVTKESGVREVCRLLGIGMSDVMAIGDSENDRLLLLEAGLGVAMGNAEPGIQAVAGARTDSNNRDGVAKAIQSYIFGGEAAQVEPDNRLINGY